MYLITKQIRFTPQDVLMNVTGLLIVALVVIPLYPVTASDDVLAEGNDASREELVVKSGDDGYAKPAGPVVEDNDKNVPSKDTVEKDEEVENPKRDDTEGAANSVVNDREEAEPAVTDVTKDSSAEVSAKATGDSKKVETENTQKPQSDTDSSDAVEKTDAPNGEATKDQSEDEDVDSTNAKTNAAEAGSAPETGAPRDRVKTNQVTNRSSSTEVLPTATPDAVISNRAASESAADASTPTQNASSFRSGGSNRSSSASDDTAGVVDFDVANRSLLGAAAQASTSDSEDVGEIVFDSSATATASSTVATATASTTTEMVIGSSSPATSTGIETKIVSGSAVALANILNIVNTNFINSSGVVVFKNFFETLLEDFDLRALYSGLQSAGCSLISCASSDVQANISNDATIENALMVEAISGRNSINEADSAVISTGDAYAGVNLINVANTNVIDSNYLLVTINAFKGVDGDIVFPSLATFFSGLANSSPSGLALVNTAEVTNTVSTDASSGGNTVSDTGSSTIVTGASVANTSVINQLNTSLVGQNIAIVFRVQGDWVGEVFGAPPGLSWMEDGLGGIYLFDSTGASGAVSSGASIQATNTAAITNNVNVVALTGENAISGANTALISTGDAYAGANIMNVANATVVGKNWILAIVNILGDFNGNIAFGRPDLWVGAKADVPHVIENGSEVTYTFTVINNGDSRATNVVLTNEYDATRLRVPDGVIAASTGGATGALRLPLPDLGPGEATEIQYTAVVQNAGSGEAIANRASVNAKETDNNLDDNADEVLITTRTVSAGGSTRTGVRLSAASLVDMSAAALAERVTIERVTAAGTSSRGSEEAATQLLRVTNTSDRAIRSVVLHDMLYTPNGLLLSDEVWELGDIEVGEQLEISYEVRFGPSAPLGVYALRTQLLASGYDAYTVANGTLLVVENPVLVVVSEEPAVTPEVLGASTSTQQATGTEEVEISLSSIKLYRDEAASAASVSATSQSNSSYGWPLAVAASGEALPDVPAVPAWFVLIGLLLALLGIGILYRHFR